VSNNKYRLLVRLDPSDLGGRALDEMPAAIKVTTKELHERVGGAGKIDISSIQVERYDPASGKPIRYGKWAYSQTDWDVPYRWYDASIPEDFPEFQGSINGTQGELRYQKTKGWGYFYETVGEWDGGRLAWIHTQERSQPSYYAIYFNFLPEGQEPDSVERRGFLGDGYERTTEVGPTTDGLRVGRVETVDWNGDGLTDLLLGCEGRSDLVS